ncbi:hypothetical protein K439DRAFT_1659052 [Ramaria rubella]|nr:hypothetical protein K439DRAFT_1659052 [Ramaria rubella]
MNLQQLYFMVQGFAALYFVAVVIPSFSIEVYQPRHNSKPTFYTPTPSAPSDATANVNSLILFEETSIALRTVAVKACDKMPTVTFPTAIIPLPDPPKISPSLPMHKARQIVSESPGSRKDVSKPHDFITLSNSICLLAFAIVIGTVGTAGTRRFARAMSQQRRLKDRDASWRREVIPDAHDRDKPIEEYDSEEVSVSQRDIFALHNRLRSSNILNQFAVPSARTVIPTRVHTKTGNMMLNGGLNSISMEAVHVVSTNPDSNQDPHAEPSFPMPVTNGTRERTRHRVREPKSESAAVKNLHTAVVTSRPSPAVRLTSRPAVVDAIIPNTHKLDHGAPKLTFPVVPSPILPADNGTNIGTSCRAQVSEPESIPVRNLHSKVALSEPSSAMHLTSRAPSIKFVPGTYARNERTSSKVTRSISANAMDVATVRKQNDRGLSFLKGVQHVLERKRTAENATAYSSKVRTSKGAKLPSDLKTYRKPSQAWNSVAQDAVLVAVDADADKEVARLQLVKADIDSKFARLDGHVGILKNLRKDNTEKLETTDNFAPTPVKVLAFSVPIGLAPTQTTLRSSAQTSSTARKVKEEKWCLPHFDPDEIQAQSSSCTIASPRARKLAPPSRLQPRTPNRREGRPAEDRPSAAVPASSLAEPVNIDLFDNLDEFFSSSPPRPPKQQKLKRTVHADFVDAVFNRSELVGQSTLLMPKFLAAPNTPPRLLKRKPVPAVYDAGPEHFMTFAETKNLYPSPPSKRPEPLPVPQRQAVTPVIPEELPIFDPNEIKSQSSIPDFAALSAPQTSWGPDPIPRPDILRLLKRSEEVHPAHATFATDLFKSTMNSAEFRNDSVDCRDSPLLKTAVRDVSEELYRDDRRPLIDLLATAVSVAPVLVWASRRGTNSLDMLSRTAVKHDSTVEDSTGTTSMDLHCKAWVQGLLARGLNVERSLEDDHDHRLVTDLFGSSVDSPAGPPPVMLVRRTTRQPIDASPDYSRSPSPPPLVRRAQQPQLRVRNGLAHSVEEEEMMQDVFGPKVMCRSG